MIKLEDILKEIKNNEILSKDEIKQIAKYNLKFSSDEYSDESDYFNNETLKDKYLDILNNPTLNSLIEADLISLLIEYGDEIFTDLDFLDVMGEYMTTAVRHTLGEKRFEEVKTDLSDYVEKYSKSKIERVNTIKKIIKRTIVEYLYKI